MRFMSEGSILSDYIRQVDNSQVHPACRSRQAIVLLDAASQPLSPVPFGHPFVDTIRQ
jgi:hypothetical protein